MIAAAKPGRPMKMAEEGERVMLGLRVSAELKNKLDEAARKSGRSQSQEAEMRIQQTFFMEAMMEAIAGNYMELPVPPTTLQREMMLKLAVKAGVISQDQVDAERERMNAQIEMFHRNTKGDDAA